MFRKFALAFAAVAALGTASLAVSSTPAEAKKGFHKGHFHKGHGKHWHGHKGHWHGVGIYAPLYASYGGCYVKRLVATPWGYKVRWVNRCF